MEYKVSFDGKWQEDFDDLDEALTWGREVAETGRLVVVVRSSMFRKKLVAVFPEEQFEDGKFLFENRAGGSAYGWQEYFSGGA